MRTAVERVNPEGLILPNSRAKVLHQCEQCRWAGGMKGRLMRAQTTPSKRISCKRQPSTHPSAHPRLVNPRPRKERNVYGGSVGVQLVWCVAESLGRRGD